MKTYHCVEDCNIYDTTNSQPVVGVIPFYPHILYYTSILYYTNILYPIRYAASTLICKDYFLEDDIKRTGHIHQKPPSTLKHISLNYAIKVMDGTNGTKVKTAEDLLKGLKRSGIDISLKDAVNLLSQITDEK